MFLYETWTHSLGHCKVGFSVLEGHKRFFGHAKIDLAGYADADGSMAKDRHAISRYAFIVHGGAISWSAKCQDIISL
jgi:hypothetical protein